MAAVESIKVSSTTTYSSSAGADAMKQALYETAEALADLLGLVVIDALTKTYTYGAIYFIGESKDSNYPLLCIGNQYPSNSSYYYYGYYISICTNGPNPLIGLESRYQSDHYYNGYYVEYKTSGNVSFTLSYIKTDAVFAFRIGTSNTGEFIITEMSNGIDKHKVCFMVYNKTLYYSYCPITSSYSTSVCMNRASLLYTVDITEDILCDLYAMQGYKLNALKVFTNRAEYEFGVVVDMDGTYYQIVYYNTDNLAIVIKLS